MSIADCPQGAGPDSVIAVSPSSVLSALDAKLHLFFTTITRSMHQSHFVDQTYEAQRGNETLQDTQLVSAEQEENPS